VASWEGPPRWTVTADGSGNRRMWWKEAKSEHRTLVADALAAGATRPATKPATKPTDKLATKSTSTPASTPADKPVATAAQLELALAAVSTRPDPEAAAYKNQTKAWHIAQAAWVESWGGGPPPALGRGELPWAERHKRWWKWSKWQHGQLAAEAMAGER
jgi:hypothetical protein